MARTDDAERVAEYIAQKPLLAESVYRGPKYPHKRGDKQVTDLLLVHRDMSLVIEIKCQNDPDSRWNNDLASWVAKAGEKGISQLRGSIRTLREHDYWCDHPTFGRVDFSKDQLTPIHGLVLIEHRTPGASVPSELPYEVRGVPISYFTLSDFLILVTQLRTFSDLRKYLDSRHNLTDFDARITGREEELLGHYMLHNGCFPPGWTHEQRLTEIHHKRSDFETILLQKRFADEECEEAEAAARALRKRAAGYPPRRADDKNYRVMQLALMDLTYAERRLVGRKIKQAINEVSGDGPPGIRLSAHAVITNANLSVIIGATNGASPTVASHGLEHSLKKFIEYTSQKNLLLINVRENSPKYQFVYLPVGSLSGIEPIDCSLPRGIPPSWITYTPKAPF